eukprot:TRINITY_DN1877_c0_g1_i1.p1 TRINITY_DN1877_c0_g1~~TRINITY_DN1877_c0_g1_i1.p1  ORF type:complete len:626 (+),score=116.22 TRINITY_DN1877_c0_g1_i1:147-2024(+)
MCIRDSLKRACNVKSAHSMRAGTQVRWKEKVRAANARGETAGKRKHTIGMKASRLLSKYRFEGEERFTMDLAQLMEEAHESDVFEAVSGVKTGTDWTSLRSVYGESEVECDGARMKLHQWVRLWCSQKFDGRRAWVTIRTVARRVDLLGEEKQQLRSTVRAAVRWCMRRKKHAKPRVEPTLEVLRRWERVVSMVPAAIRMTVRARIRAGIRRVGGEIVPNEVRVRVPAGVTVQYSNVRQWWYQMIDTEKAAEPAYIRRAWKAALRIVRGKGEQIEQWMVNATRKCAAVDFEQCEPGTRTRCVCAQKPQLVEVMKARYPERWKELGHIHMSAADVPWRVRGVGAVNVRSTVVDGDRKATAEFWTAMENVAFRACGKVRARGRGWLRQARGTVLVHKSEVGTDDRFSVGAVTEYVRKCDKGSGTENADYGLARTVLDRNPGQAWLTCQELFGRFGRDHFRFAEDENEWQRWDVAKGERPKYWRVRKEEHEVLREWRAEYESRRKACGNRWCAWNAKGKMTSARWQFKQKNEKKIRAIFNGQNDPAVREMQVAAKCVGLIRETLGTDDFAMTSAVELGQWLDETERLLLLTYGENTELMVQSTDFKEFFPSNKKSAMVALLERPRTLR